MAEETSRLRRAGHFLAHTILHSFFGAFLHPVWALVGGAALSAIVALWGLLKQFDPVTYVAIGAFCTFSLVAILGGLAQHLRGRVRQGRSAPVTEPPAAVPPAAPLAADHLEEPMASKENVHYLRVLYNEHFGRAFTLALEIFYGDLYERLKPFTRHLITEYVLNRLTASKATLEEKLRGTGGFTQADFTDSVLMLFRKTMLDYVTFVGVIKNAGREIVGDELLLRQSWYAQLYERHAAAAQKLKEVRYHPDLAWTVDLILPMLDDLVLSPPKEAREQPP